MEVYDRAAVKTHEKNVNIQSQSTPHMPMHSDTLKVTGLVALGAVVAAVAYRTMYGSGHSSASSDQLAAVTEVIPMQGTTETCACELCRERGSKIAECMCDPSRACLDYCIACNKFKASQKRKNAATSPGDTGIGADRESAPGRAQ
jgi:hypothetical protein